METRTIPRTLHELSNNDQTLTEKPATSKISKNSIFDIVHTVTRPKDKMSVAELEQLNASSRNFPSSPINLRSKQYRPYEKIEITNPKLPLLPTQPYTKLELPESILINYPSLDSSIPSSIDLAFNARPSMFIGEGRHSKVYLGYYKQTSSMEIKACAVKLMYSDPESHALAENEAGLMLALAGSPYILKLICKRTIQSPQTNESYELALAKRKDTKNIIFGISPILVLEYCEMGSLYSLYNSKSRQIINNALVLDWIYQLASAISSIHILGIIHHDLKPQNILLTQDLNGRMQIRVADFGGACYVPEALYSNKKRMEIVPGLPISPDSQILHDASGRGTTVYCAPETLKPDGMYSFPVDMYSLGCIIFGMITLVAPFGKDKTGMGSVGVMMAILRGFFESRCQVFDLDENWYYAGNGELVFNGIRKIVEGLICRDDRLRFTASDVLRLVKDISSQPKE